MFFAILAIETHATCLCSVQCSCYAMMAMHEVVPKHYCDTFSGSAAGDVDLTCLSIVPHKKCWVIYVDALILNTDGAILDAVTMAMRAALADIQLPGVEITQAEGSAGPEIELNNEELTKWDAGAVPVIVTVAQVGCAWRRDLYNLW